MSPTGTRPPAPRVEGYLPIRGYAAIGDRHTVALVGCDGSVDWLCLPSFDERFVLGALLDADRGGRFALAPTEPYEVQRRYIPETNVLETTFSTAQGQVRVTDALTIAEDDGGVRELVRLAEALGDGGGVELAWRVEPRFAHTQRPARIDRRDDGALVARRDGEAVVVQAWEAGEPVIEDGAIHGRFTVGAGAGALLTLAATPIEAGPLPFTTRGKVEARLALTIEWWRSWCRGCSYDGPWREEVIRSALVLKMLVYAPTGAIAAAPTTGLPEAIGGSSNWDYRFSWLRDSSFAVDALLRLGDREEAERFISWLMAASREEHPRLQPFYRLDGSSDISQHELELDGYRGSRPVLEGNGAVHQRQLSNYGDVFQLAALYAEDGGVFDGEVRERLGGIADYVCEAWSERDSGLWELGTRRHYTHSKMLCWVALDRAVKLAGEGKLSGEHTDRWREAAARIRDFVEERCWSPQQGSYLRSADAEDFDAGVLLGIVFGYETSEPDRFHRTVDRLREELGRGPLLYRYTGMADREGAFLACSFWLAHALARLERVEEAEQLMDELLVLANDVGLYSEEMDPPSGDMLGNFPQALTQLALINAAVKIAEVRGRR